MVHALEDLKNERLVAFQDFCRLVLNFDTNLSSTSSIDEDPYLRDGLNDYCSALHGNDQYKAFFELVDYVLRKSHSPYFLRRYGSTLFLDGYTELDHDGHGLPLSSANDGCNNPADGSVSDMPFYPLDAVSFIEFKLTENNEIDCTPEADIHTQPTSPRPKRKADSEADASDSLTPPDAGQSTSHKSPRLNTTKIPGRITPIFMTPEYPRVASDDIEPLEPHLSQCAGYALEMLSQGLRHHVIGLLVTDAQIEFLYYDRSIILRSHPLKFVDNWRLLAATLTHMGHISLAQWGYHPCLPEMEPMPSLERFRQFFPSTQAEVTNPVDGVTLIFQDKSQLELGDIVHQAHGLSGRGTLVVRAKHKDGLGHSIVVKISWPSSSKCSESEILAKIEEKIEETQVSWVKDHLPKILHSEDHEDSTGIQARLAEHFGDEYEKRTLRLIVYEELEPISKLKDALQLGKAFADTVKCHRWVFERAGILHRDISLSNLMFRKKANGEICGVLNDFDLATSTSQLGDGPMSKQRTGTRPFMAVDLLKKTPPPPHKYRYDLESFLYALCFLVGDPSQLSVQEWSVRGTLGLVDAKIALFVKAPDEFVLPEYQGMSTCIATVQDGFYPIYRPTRFSGSSKVDVDSDIVPIIAEAFVNLPDDLS